MTEPQFASYASICGWHGCTCQRCGRRYYVDLIVPDDVWAKIKPDTSRDGGLLCGRCMLDAIEASGHGAWLLTDLVNNVTTPAPAEDEAARCTRCGKSAIHLAGGVCNTCWMTAPAPAEDDDDDGHGPWFYTEFGVLCSCRYPVDADERCTRPRDAAGQREELLGALFETADSLLEYLARAGTIAVDDAHVDDLRYARDALAEWHAPAPAREQADPADEDGEHR